MGSLIVGLTLFAGAALFGDDGYTWLVALMGALAVVHGTCTVVLRSRPRARERFRCREDAGSSCAIVRQVGSSRNDRHAHTAPQAMGTTCLTTQPS